MEHEGVVQWEDVGRVAGLPVLFQRYRLDEKALHVSRGLLATEEDRILTYRILDVRVYRSLLDRMLGLGTVIIYGADASDPVIQLRGVRHPLETADLIQEQAEKARAAAGIQGREIYGAAAEQYWKG